MARSGGQKDESSALTLPCLGEGYLLLALPQALGKTHLQFARQWRLWLRQGRSTSFNTVSKCQSLYTCSYTCLYTVFSAVGGIDLKGLWLQTKIKTDIFKHGHCMPISLQQLFRSVPNFMTSKWSSAYEKEPIFSSSLVLYRRCRFYASFRKCWSVGLFALNSVSLPHRS